MLNPLKIVPMPPSIEEVARMEPVRAQIEYVSKAVTDMWRPKIEAARTAEEQARMYQDYRYDLEMMLRPMLDAAAKIKALERPSFMVLSA